MARMMSAPARSILLRRRTFAAATFGAALSGVAAAAAPLRPLRLGDQRTGVIRLARLRGAFDTPEARAAVGPVEWTNAPSGAMVEALQAGVLDIALVGPTAPIFGQIDNAPLRYIAAEPQTGAHEGILVRREDPIHRPQDLAGKRIGLAFGSSAHLFVVEMGRRLGFSPHHIQIVDLAPDKGQAALEAGHIDAWVVWDPLFAMAQENPKFRTLATAAGETRRYSFYLARSPIVQHQPQRVQAALNILWETARWGRAKPQETAELIAQAIHLPLPTVLTSLRKGAFVVEPLDSNILALQQATADHLFEWGVVPRQVRIADIYWSDWKPPVAGPLGRG